MNDISALLASIHQAVEPLAKANAAESAVMLLAELPPAQRDAALSQIKNAVKGAVKAATIDQMLKDALAARPGESAKSEAPVLPYFRIEEGEIWAGRGEDSRKVTSGGACWYTELVDVDDGEEKSRELTLTVQITGRQPVEVRVPAKDTGDEAALIKAIRGVAAPMLSVVAKQRRILPQAIDEVSRGQKMSELREIKHTGWIETDKGLVFVTPGGIVGELPAATRIALPDEARHYALTDEGDEAFKLALKGLIGGFIMQAFHAEVSYPALAFALLPACTRWLPGSQKFMMHFTGETGSLKTHTATALMALYGAKFATAQPLTNWASTINSIERLGWYLPDVLGLVDDYKMALVKGREFFDTVHRYADGNNRNRLSRSGTELQVKRAPRWWLLSTGEDVPVGESSVLARMVMLRFPRRPLGSPENFGLTEMRKYAKYFPTVTARWCAWLRENATAFDFESHIVEYRQKVALHIQSQVPDVPNVNRIAQNVATLWAVWDAFWQFYRDCFSTRHDDSLNLVKAFEAVALSLASNQASQAMEQKPTHIFLEAIQEGIDSGEFELLPTSQLGTSLLKVLAGWQDDKGIYLLPALYDRISQRKFGAQQQLGFSKQELYRLLREEGLIVQSDKKVSTIVKSFGPPQQQKLRRVLWLRKECLIAPQAGNEPEDQQIPF